MDISTYEADLMKPVLPTTLREIVWPHCSRRNPLIVTISQMWLLLNEIVSGSLVDLRQMNEMFTERYMDTNESCSKINI